MEKFILTDAHYRKRKQKKRFVLRYDIFGTFLCRKMSVEDYFDFHFSYPDEADKVILDAMYAGDFCSVYDSEILPLRQSAETKRFHDLGIDIFGKFIDNVHSKGKECFLTYRIAEAEHDLVNHPLSVYDDHPEWFIPAFGYHLNNLAVPEVRERQTAVLSEVMRKYPFDGLDIDFERHTPYLPVGRQWENRECVTSLMRRLRAECIKIGKEQNRVVMLSARIPDCLAGCHMDGLDVEEWIKEDLVDCLTLGSRSFDVRVEEFRRLSDDIQLYGCYDAHHTVDGYTFPPPETIRGVWYSWLQRGADGIEYFNWAGEGKPETVRRYADKYHGKDEDYYPCFARDDFTGVGDKAYLGRQNKTYVIDRKGGYPWGIGYGNLNADRQLPCVIEKEGSVTLYVAENAGLARRSVLRLIFEELDGTPEIVFGKQKLNVTVAPYRDFQITTEKEVPVTSAFTVAVRMRNHIDMSKPCTVLTADVTGIPTVAGYNEIRILTDKPVRLEKAELDVIYI